MRRTLAFVLASVVISCAPPSPVSSTTATSSAGPTASVTAPRTAPPSPSPSSPRQQRFGAPVFVSEQVGWIPTFDDRVFHMTASGWSEQHVPNTTFLAGLDFVGTLVGWAIGVAGDPICGAAAVRNDRVCRAALLRTVDGGATWSEQTAYMSDHALIPLRGLRAISRDAVWAIRSADCAPGMTCVDDLLVTEDAGRSWRSTLTVARLLGLEASSASEAWAIVATTADPARPYEPAYEVRHTIDGGRTWHVTLSSTYFLYATRRASSLWILERDGAYCTASSCGKYVLRSSADGGQTWSDLGNPKDSATCSGGHLGPPSFSDRDLRTGVIPISLGAGGVLVGSGGLLLTNDGGRTWTCGTTPPNVTSALAVMGSVVAVSNDRAVNADTVWIRSASGVWSRVLP